MTHCKKNYLNNQRGGMAALLSVIVLSLIMVSTLSSFYIYLENRAKFQQRLRENYQMGYVMEDAGKALVQARTAYNQGSDTCPAGLAPRYLDCYKVCMQDTLTLAQTGVIPAGTPRYAICIKSATLNKIVNSADYFCAFNDDPTNGLQRPVYCDNLADNESLGDGATMMVSNHTYEKSKINNWYSRLDKFYDTTIVKNAPVLANKIHPFLEAKFQPPTVFGWLLPQTAYAISGGGSSGGGGSNPPPITVYPPTGEVADVSLDECKASPSAACSIYCEQGSEQAFCKNLHVKITVPLIGGASGGVSSVSSSQLCNTTGTDPRCKRCGSTERNNGTCLLLSVCPPWTASTECRERGRGNNDGSATISQMVRIEP